MGTLRAAARVAGLVFVGACSSTTIINEIPPTDGGERDATRIDTDATLMPTDASVSPDDGTANPPGDTGARDAGVDEGGKGDGDAARPDASDGGCVGLECQVPPGCTTSLSGVVRDPAGVNGVRGAVVFVPTDPAGAIPAIAQGATSCNTCSVPVGRYLTAGLTDADGRFSLTGVPAGTRVPLVVQLGKWRREVFLPTVTACTDNAVAATLSHLPRNRSEGDLPQMAVLTGAADNLGCFPAAIGVDPQEYTAPHGGGRVDVYRGLPGAPLFAGGPSAPGLSTGTAGDCTTSSCPLWGNGAQLERYDVVLLSCEGNEYLQNKPASSIQAMHDWLGAGGRVLATHFQYSWFRNGPADFQGLATWLGSSGGNGAGTFSIDTQSPAGAALHQQLADSGALTNDQVALAGVASSVGSVDAGVQRLVYDPSTTNTKLLSFLTPVGGACGRAVFSDAHFGGAPAGDVPSACGANSNTPAFRALEFAFFALSACAADDTTPPPLPPSTP